MSATRQTTNVLPYDAQSVKAAVSVNGRETEYRVEKARDLVLRVRPNGKAAWYFYYRTKTGSGDRTQWKLRKLRLGDRDSLSLRDARVEVEALRTNVNRGGDPVADREAKRVEAEEAKRAAQRKGMTFLQLFNTRLERDDSIKPGTRTFYRNALEGRPNGAKSVMDQIGDTPADDITPQQIVAVLDKIEARGARFAADQAKAAISATYRWALKRHSVKSNPAADLGKRVKRDESVRDRSLAPEELKTLWLATVDPAANLSPPMRLIIQLAVLCGQRRTEVAGARREELNLDGPSPVWIIPGDKKLRSRRTTRIHGRTKNSKDQHVPLSRQAAKLWREALAITDGAEYVFPADTAHVKAGSQPKVPHIRGDSVSMAVRRLRTDFGLDDVVLHDMRRTVGSWCGDSGIRPDVVQQILSHKPQDVTRRHYNQSTLEPLVRQALQAWANYVDSVVRGEVVESDKVVELAVRA